MGFSANNGWRARVAREPWFHLLTGGEGGIRTHDTVTGILPFQGSQFNRSCTSPSEVEAGPCRIPKSTLRSFGTEYTGFPGENQKRERHSRLLRPRRSKEPDRFRGKPA
jgi:hypothetical protein